MEEGINVLPEIRHWQTSTEYSQESVGLTPAKFLEVTDLLLENPNLNSSHLFRADILFDSTGTLKTALEKEKDCFGPESQNLGETSGHDGNPHDLPEQDCQLSLNGVPPDRVIVRKLIPRNTNIDQPLKQTCLVYQGDPQGSTVSYTVVYFPVVKDETKVPWYHPPVRALAYVYEKDPLHPASEAVGERAKLSLHFLHFHDSPGRIPDRLHRTFISLMKTFIRLSNGPSPPSIASHSGDESASARSTAPSALKDTILPQHIVQDTYARLKQTYAPDLIARWVESTEPSKHVFEDLSIAAFLIELWKTMFRDRPFPGFVDLACGNGVLVYILLQEGYSGWGFDARRRKTWDVLDIDENLSEQICVPQPFLDALDLSVEDAITDTKIHNGIFPKDTFIISNHADELTPWTPLLASLSSPSAPLPFLAIPCCSHALSGAKHRYTPKSLLPPKSSTPANEQHILNDSEPQPTSGDLKALRAQKTKAVTHNDDKSMYACLTKKVVALAEEVGCEVKMTLMRIPSTRNIGVVGGWKTSKGGFGEQLDRPMSELSVTKDGNIAGTKVQEIVERECQKSGGVEASARSWIERARGLQTGKGRGKLNLGHKPDEHVNGS